MPSCPKEIVPCLIFEGVNIATVSYLGSYRMWDGYLSHGSSHQLTVSDGSCGIRNEFQHEERLLRATPHPILYAQPPRGVYFLLGFKPREVSK